LNPAEQDMTETLLAVCQGQRGAVARLTPALYDSLRAMAREHLDRERADHTLQPTALVNEAYLRLIDQRVTRWENRAHFLAVAARVMRRVLIDHARARHSLKRGGQAQRVPLSGLEAGGSAGAAGWGDGGTEPDLLELDGALERLAAIDETGARVVEMRFFGGMEETEIAGVLGISDRTVRRHWVYARAWLFRELGGHGGSGPAAGGGGAGPRTTGAGS
jgi:RNA polymerase sigma-70 factor (ECF subfamily)